MTIQVEETAIPDVKIIRSARFHDDRGYFNETYREFEFLEIGIPKFVQDNLSESAKGVIRGLHWQNPPFGQGKLVSCIQGSIFDVAVDLRRESTTFGKHVSVELNTSEQMSLWIPEGFAHGFQSLEDKTKVLYKVTNYWSKESEQNINPLDVTLRIKWPIAEIKLSDKDMRAPSFQVG